ncbi:MAG: FkbM family methyltransferase [Synergistaceae bacterium]|nr:FkbM family methyltransferase [Synergistaceae bacterium]
MFRCLPQLQEQRRLYFSSALLRKYCRGGGGRKYFVNPFFTVGGQEVYLDVGAYDGDTVREFLNASNGKYRKILALEPAKGNFEALKKYVEDSKLPNIEIFRNGCGDKNGVAHLASGLFKESFSVGDSASGDAIEIKRIDDQFAAEEITLIKISLLAGVVETLRGAEKTLQQKHPNLVITVGFNARGIIDIPKTIKELNPNIKLSLRYAYHMPARLILYGY